MQWNIRGVLHSGVLRIGMVSIESTNLRHSSFDTLLLRGERGGIADKYM